MTSVIMWAEIPVADYERAKTFYEAVTDSQMYKMDAGEGCKSAGFAREEESFGGACILQAPDFTPNTDGVLIYLNAGDDVEGMLKRAADAGGEVVIPRQAIGEADSGYFATFTDSEGNTIGLYGSN